MRKALTRASFLIGSVAVLAVGGVFAVGAVFGEDTRVAVPRDGDVDREDEQVRTLFAAEFGKATSDQAKNALAEKLLEDARNSGATRSGVSLDRESRGSSRAKLVASE